MTSTKISLTDEQFSTLVNGLQVAAKKFEENAKSLRMATPVSGKYEAMAATFEQQAKDTWALSYVFNGAEKVEVTNAE